MNSTKLRNEQENKDGRMPYESPKIIYKGKISTRAGSPLSPDGGSDSTVVDPADLFGGSD